MFTDKTTTHRGVTAINIGQDLNGNPRYIVHYKDLADTTAEARDKIAGRLRPTTGYISFTTYDIKGRIDYALDN